MIEEVAAMIGLDVFQFSILIIIIAIVVIMISITVNLTMTKRSKEENVATKVLKNVKLIQKGKIVPKRTEEKVEVKKEKTDVKKETKEDGISMKEHLSKKFKPKIEKQLKTKINLLDFSGKGKDFQALVEVGGVKVLLILDASGKIIDYKKK